MLSGRSQGPRTVVLLISLSHLDCAPEAGTFWGHSGLIINTLSVFSSTRVFLDLLTLFVPLMSFPNFTD